MNRVETLAPALATGQGRKWSPLLARLWLLLPLAMVVAPHVRHLPTWLSAAWLACALASLGAVWRGRVWPAWIKLPLALAGVLGVLLHYGTVIGPSGGVALLVFLSGVKLLELSGARDRIGLLFVACFLLVAHFLEAQSLSTALYMALAALAVTAGLVAEQRAVPQPADTVLSAGRLLLQALPLALLLFLLFPRLPGPLWGLPQQRVATTGLSERMSPGDIGQLARSDAIALRAEFIGTQPDGRQLYWRGPVLWDYDGRVWQTTPPSPATGLSAIGLGTTTRYVVTLEPHQQRWLLLLGLPTRLPVVDSTLDGDLRWLTRQPVRERLRYEVEAWLDFRLQPDLPPEQRARALALPAGNPRSVALARQWAGQHDDGRALVGRALNHFHRQNFHYTLQPPLLGADAVDAFLFDARRGFCEHYAGAFVFLMRAAGVPARVVTGYQGGELNPLGGYWIVRQRDAHAWAEVWLPGEGWVRVDPTAAVAPERIERGIDAALPSAEQPAPLLRLGDAWLRPVRLTWDMLNNQWNQWVLGYDQARQRSLMQRVSPHLADWRAMVSALALGGALLLALLVAALWWRHGGGARKDAAWHAYRRFRRRLARCGVAEDATEAPEDYLHRVVRLHPQSAKAAESITRAYLAARYGRPDPRALRRLLAKVARFRPHP